MVEVVVWVRGLEVRGDLPDSMPAGIRAQVVRSALNGAYARTPEGVLRVSRPDAYVAGALRRKSLDWGTPDWPKTGMALLREPHRRRALKLSEDPLAAVRAMRDDPRGFGRAQLAAVAGHDPACPGACRACRALDRGDWAAYAHETGMDPITAENAYLSLADAGLVGPARRPGAGRGSAPANPWAL